MALHQKVAFRSISTAMVQRIIVLALLCLVVVGGVQAWLEWKKQTRQFLNAMALLTDASSRAIGYALWDIEREVLLHHVEELAAHEAVGFVRIRTLATDEVITAGRRKSESNKAPAYQARIHSPNDQALVLGAIEVWADADYRRNLLWDSQKQVAAGYLIFTMLLCVMVAWVIRRDLGLPLQQLAKKVEGITPETLGKPLALHRPQRMQSDEIDSVVQGFYHLQAALHRHIQDLDGLVQERTAELQALVDEVKRLSQLDALTGAYNRRAMELRLPLEIQRSVRYQRPFSVIFTDIDRFKRINDQHGHAEGDLVLKEVAQRLQHGLRLHVDWMVRFGGEEFVIFLPETDLQAAVTVAERLAHTVRSTPWVVADGTAVALSSSFGVTQLRAEDSVESLLQRADALLYRAKHAGRDRVCASVA